MERQEIQDLIDRQVSEAKLEVVTKRLELILWIGGALLALFGLVLPVWQLSQSTSKLDDAITTFRTEFDSYSQRIQSDSKELSKVQASQSDLANQRIDKALSELQKQFKELAGTQLRRPVLEFFFAGSPLEGAVLSFSASQQTQRIELKNIGDAPANNIRIRLYINTEQDQDPSSNQLQLYPQEFSDEPAFKKMLEAFFSVPIDPKESKFFEILFPADFARKNYPCLIKVFYGQPEPKKYVFSIIAK